MSCDHKSCRILIVGGADIALPAGESFQAGLCRKKLLFYLPLLTGLSGFGIGLCEDAEQWGNIGVFILATSQLGKKISDFQSFPNLSK